MSSQHDNRLTRIGNGTKPYYGIYRCACGIEKQIYDYSVRYGTSTSCGCRRSEWTQQHNRGNQHGRKHGMYATRVHRIWRGMMNRCYDARTLGYELWGGRGITVCERWRGKHGFENFLADMGEPPSTKHSIDRIDNDGNYEPGNCRWATAKEQLRNRRTNWNVTFGGKTQCISAWVEELGIPRPTLTNRLKRGWSVERAMTEPVRLHKNK
jgi:hypothetical protein